MKKRKPNAKELALLAKIDQAQAQAERLIPKVIYWSKRLEKARGRVRALKAHLKREWKRLQEEENAASEDENKAGG
jgi:cell division protein FtsL